MTIASGILDWSPEAWVLVIGALGTAIVGIIQAFRANAKADVMGKRVDSIARSQDTIRSDMLTVASNQPPPTTPTNPTPVAPPVQPAGDAGISTISDIGDAGSKHS